LPAVPRRSPPSGPGWIHEIKHDGFRLMVRRDPAGVRLLTRNGHDWADRYPLIVEASGALQVRSFLLDGDAVACDGDGCRYSTGCAAGSQIQGLSQARALIQQVPVRQWFFYHVT